MVEIRQVTEDEFTFRYYILKARSYFDEVLRYWYIPFAFGLLFAAYQAYKYYSYVPLFPASITFSVDEDEAGGQSALTGMLSQFGIGNLRPARYNFDKILELGRSRRVVQEALFSKTTIDGKEDFIANHIIKIYELSPVSAEEGGDAPFYFTHDSFPIFDRRENEVLLNLYNFVIGPPSDPSMALVTTSYNEETNIITLTAATTNETLSLELARHMFQSLSDYYINKAIEKSLKTYKIVTMKRDSVLGELRSKEYQLANFKDRNKALIIRTDQLPESRLHREVLALGTMYTEVLKNVEMAEFGLRNKTPFIQVIDSPIPPIQPTQLSLIRKLILGFIMGAIIGAVIVAARQTYREIMVVEHRVT